MFFFLVETCKKRWKYLRERYVQQLKQGIPPTYEHLSRPYLEKMKFLDQHIQPRKSYRNMSSFLPSPNASFVEYMDSRSNGSMHNNSTPYPNYHENMVSNIKVEPTTFQNFASASSGTSPTGQHNPPSSHHPPNSSTASSATHPNPQSNHSGPHSSDNRENDVIPRIPSSSSSLKSPLSSPHASGHQDMNESMKRARLATNPIPRRNEDPDDSSDNDEGPPHPSLQQRQQQELLMNETLRRRNCRNDPSQPPSNDFLYSFYQRFMPPNQMRCSEQLLGELVTSELLKMSKEKRKIAQRRILEVLFFDD